MRGIGKIIVIGFILAIAAFFYFYTRAIKPKVFVTSVPATPSLVEGTWNSSPIDAYINKFLKSDGRFDFEAARSDPLSEAELDGYLAACALASPDSAPQRFPDSTSVIAYWLRAHDAMSIKTVLRAWPIKSLLEVRAEFSVVEGSGYFRGISFPLGGKGTTIHGLLTQVLPRVTKDPRVILAMGGPARFVLPYSTNVPTGTAQNDWLNERVARFFDEEDRLVVRGNEVGIAAWVFWREEWFIGVAPPQTEATEDRLVAALATLAPPAARRAFVAGPNRTYRPLPADFRVR